MEAGILNIQRLWHTIQGTSTIKLLLQELSRWISYLCSLLRLRYHEHRKEKPRPQLPPARFPPKDDMGIQNTRQSDESMSFTGMSLPHSKDCTTFHSDNDIISLSDATIALSKHPFFSSGDTTPCRNVTGTPIFQSLGQSSSIPTPNTPNRAVLPTHSVAHSLPPIEGPAGEPKKLTAELGEQSNRFIPLVPSDHKRYARNVTMPETASAEIALEPLQMQFSQTDPDGWKSYLHREGVLYFCNIEKRIYTDANLYDADVLGLVDECIREIYHFLEINAIVISPAADLVLDVVSTQMYYYFADHRNRTVFYLDKISASDFSTWNEVKGASSMSHFAHLIDAEYWWHIFLFPSSLTMREDIVNELRDVVIHYIGDAITSSYSTSTFSNEDLLNLLSVTDSLKEDVGTLYGGSICMISRFMWSFSHIRFLHWHGQPAVRFSRDSSAHGPIMKARSKVMKIASTLLFGAPEVHLRNLETVWVDRMLYAHVWNNISNKLSNEWQLYILFSTVLLNANVAFLAIQTIDQTDHPYRSPGQISSYLSLIASMGSIILSMLLFRINQTRAKESAYELWEFLVERVPLKSGLEVLAIAYSLPYGLLVWSVIAFLVAIAWMCLDNANASTRALIGSASFAIAALIGFCVWIGWGSPSHYAELQGDSAISGAASARGKKFVNWEVLKKFFFPSSQAHGRSVPASANV